MVNTDSIARVCGPLAVVVEGYVFPLVLFLVSRTHRAISPLSVIAQLDISPHCTRQHRVFRVVDGRICAGTSISVYPYGCVSSSLKQEVRSLPWRHQQMVGARWLQSEIIFEYTVNGDRRAHKPSDPGVRTSRASCVPASKSSALGALPSCCCRRPRIRILILCHEIPRQQPNAG